MIKIRCVVEHITYQNQENGYSVMRVKVKDYSDLVTLVGNLLDVPVGAVLLCNGDWKVDKRYGRQFVCETWEEVMPATVYGIEKYLGSGLVKGIGPKYAHLIVERFGTDTIEVIEDDIERLYEVAGIGKKRVEKIRDSWEKQKDIKTSYKQRVIDYLAENSNNDTLRKIQHFEQLTSADIEELERIFFEELGSRNEYDELTEGHPYKNNVAAFIRVINGIDRKKALQIYQQFIEGYNLTSDQEIYLKNILDYISMNGDIETRNFLEYPLKDLKWRETFGDTFVNLKDFIKQMHRVIIA